MGLLQQLYASEGIARPEHDDFWFTSIGTMTASGVRITPDFAMRISAVYTCVNILSETLASVPLITYQRMDRGKRRARQHPLYEVLHKRPNTWMTAFDFWQWMMVHLLLRGNGYAEIVPGRRGAVDQLLPIHPDRVRIERLNNNNLRYHVRQDNGTEKPFAMWEIFHIRGMTLDGIQGISPIEYERETLGQAYAAAEYGARVFSNDATPPMWIKHPGKFKDDDEFNKFRNRVGEHQTGPNRHRPMVLENGMEAQTLSLTSEDAQYIESRKFSKEEIFGLFRVPLVLGQSGDKAQTHASAEQFFLSFSKNTMSPWFSRIEQAAERSFFDEEEPFFPEFLADALLRGDSKARSGYYRFGIQDGWLTRNEAREKENLNPLEGLDEPLQPLNMATVDDEDDEDLDDDEREERNNQRRAALTTAREELVNITEARDRLDDDKEFREWCAEYYPKFRKHLRKVTGLTIDQANTYCTESFEKITAAEDVTRTMDARWLHERTQRLYQLMRESAE